MLRRAGQVLFLAVTVLGLGASAHAAGSADLTYAGATLHVTASAVVSFRALARHEPAVADEAV